MFIHFNLNTAKGKVMDINALPIEIKELPEVFQRMYEAAPAEIVPLEWVARQAGYKHVGSLHNKISEGHGPNSFISGKRRVCDRKDAVLWIHGQTRPTFRGRAA